MVNIMAKSVAMQTELLLGAVCKVMAARVAVCADEALKAVIPVMAIGSTIDAYHVFAAPVGNVAILFANSTKRSLPLDFGAAIGRRQIG